MVEIQLSQVLVAKVDDMLKLQAYWSATIFNYKDQVFSIF